MGRRGGGQERGAEGRASTEARSGARHALMLDRAPRPRQRARVRSQGRRAAHRAAWARGLHPTRRHSQEGSMKQSIMCVGGPWARPRCSPSRWAARTRSTRRRHRRPPGRPRRPSSPTCRRRRRARRSSRRRRRRGAAGRRGAPGGPRGSASAAAAPPPGCPGRRMGSPPAGATRGTRCSPGPAGRAERAADLRRAGHRAKLHVEDVKNGVAIVARRRPARSSRPCTRTRSGSRRPSTGRA